MSVLLGNGDGTFLAAVNYGAVYAQDIVIADFNGDGKADLGVTSFDGAYFVSILPGNGDGTFKTPIDSPLSGTPNSITTADFNADGIPDLAVSTFQNTSGGNQNSGGSVSVLIGNGDGTFKVPYSYAAGAQPQAIAAADFNGDGGVDLVMTQLNGGTVTVLLGTSNAPPSSPAVAEGGVINSASFSKDVTGRGSPVAPGSLVSIFGNFPGATTQAAQNVPLPPSLGNVSVTFNGVSAPLSLVIPNGAFPFINAQLPYNVLPAGQSSGTANVIVSVNGVSSPPKSLLVTPVAPGIFTIPPNGLGNAVLVFVDPVDQITKIAAPVSASATFGYPTGPIPRGQLGFFYATGLGAITPPISNGAGASGGVPHFANAQPTVLVGGITADVKFAGQAPGYPGVNQINIVIPENAPTGDSVSLQVETTDGSFHQQRQYDCNPMMVNASLPKLRVWFAGVALSAVYGFGAGSTPSSVALLTSLSPATYGQTVTLTATVSPSAATGAVTFYDGVSMLGIARLNTGTAALKTILLTCGTHSLTAFYTGDVSYQASTSAPLSQTVTVVPGNGFQTAVNYAAGTSPGFMAKG